MISKIFTHKKSQVCVSVIDDEFSRERSLPKSDVSVSEALSSYIHEAQSLGKLILITPVKGQEYSSPDILDWLRRLEER